MVGPAGRRRISYVPLVVVVDHRVPDESSSHFIGGSKSRVIAKLQGPKKARRKE